MREELIDVQDFLHSIYINGGREDLSDAEARKLMHASAQEGIDFIDNILNTDLDPYGALSPRTDIPEGEHKARVTE